MVKYYCDRCDEEIEDTTHFFYAGLKDDDSEVDLRMVCKDCWKEALAWLKVDYKEN